MSEPNRASFLPDSKTIVKLKTEFFVPYSEVARWLGISRERVRQIAKKNVLIENSWEYKGLSDNEKLMLKKALKTDKRRIRISNCEVICLSNLYHHAVIFLKQNSIKCFFKFSDEELEIFFDADNKLDCSGKIVYKDGTSYFRPNNINDFDAMAKLKHTTRKELSLFLYRMPIIKYINNVTDSDVKNALEELSEDGVVKVIPENYRFLRRLSQTKNTTIKNLVNSYGYEYDGRSTSTRVPWTDEEKQFLENIIQVENSLHGACHFYDKLGMEHNLPHTTLFQGNMEEQIDYKKIAGKIAEIIHALSPTREIVFTNVVYVPEGWYFWNCIKSLELMSVHNETLSLVKPYIILDPNRLNLNLTNLSALQIEAIRYYGYRYAGRAFYLHITIGRINGKEEFILEMLNEKLRPQKTFMERVTVYEMGNNGTHKNTLFEVYL